jgi:sarcosine oxidase subunit gamma
VQKPEPLSPFRHRGGAAILLDAPGLLVEERALIGKLSIRGRTGDATFASCFRDVFGIEPPAPGSAVEADAATLLPVGPTEWLAVDRQPHACWGGSGTDLLRARLLAAGLITVDVSSGTTILHASGPNLHPTMRKLAALPLDRLSDGGVRRTRVGKLSILVHSLEPDRIDLFVARSFARSFVEQLQDAVNPKR